MPKPKLPWTLFAASAASIAAPASAAANLCDLRKSISLYSSDCTDEGTCPHANLESTVGATLIAGRSAEPDFRIDSCSASSDTMLTPVYSASKLITTIVLMKLVEENMLSLDEPLSAYFDWWTTSADDNRSKVALRHLLSMTAGFSYVECAYDQSIPSNITDSECAEDIYNTYGTFPSIEGISSKPADFPSAESILPGDYFCYDESSWVLAVALAKEVTGADIFQDVFDEYVATPLGIKKENCNYDSLNPMKVDGGADLSCKAQDLAKILGAYYVGDVLSSRSMNEIESNQTANIKAPMDTLTPNMDAFAAYGLGNFEISGTRNSPGVAGVTPWFDREAGYWALLFREDRPMGSMGSMGAIYFDGDGLQSMIEGLYQNEIEAIADDDCNIDCSNVPPPPAVTDLADLGPCAEAAPCFGDLGCSMFDQSTQLWNGMFSQCNEGAMFCESFFPDSSCFSKNGEEEPAAVDANSKAEINVENNEAVEEGSEGNAETDKTVAEGQDNSDTVDAKSTAEINVENNEAAEEGSEGNAETDRTVNEGQDNSDTSGAYKSMLNKLFMRTAPLLVTLFF